MQIHRTADLFLIYAVQRSPSAVPAISSPRSVTKIIITAHVTKRAKVMFSQASVCPSPGAGRSAQHLPPGQNLNPLDSTSLLPSWTTPPSPLARVKGKNTPPGTMHRWVVCILLECILVTSDFTNTIKLLSF